MKVKRHSALTELSSLVLTFVPVCHLSRHKKKKKRMTLLSLSCDLASWDILPGVNVLPSFPRKDTKV